MMLERPEIGVREGVERRVVALDAGDVGEV